jgi:hypothetical protein
MSIPGLAWSWHFARDQGNPWWVAFVAVCILVYLAALARITTAAWFAPNRFRAPRLLSVKALPQTALAVVIGVVAGQFAAPPVAVLFGVTTWLASGLTIGAAQAFVEPSDEVTAARPDGPLRDDLTVSLLAGIVAAPVVGLAFSTDLGLRNGLALGLLYGTAVGLTVASAIWRRYLAFLLATRGKLPLRLGRFLRTASDAGLLRVAGTGYQFRHADLQRWFAENGTPTTRSPGPRP